jgi:predicted transcriptional regulator
MTICGLAYQLQQVAERSSVATKTEKDQAQMDQATELFKKILKRVAASKYKLQEQSFLHPFDYDVGILRVNFVSYFFKGGADKFDILKTLSEEGITE